MTYKISWEDAEKALTMFKIPDAAKLMDFVYNFKRVIYWVVDGRYHYDPPENQTMILPHIGGIEVPIR